MMTKEMTPEQKPSKLERCQIITIVIVYCSEGERRLASNGMVKKKLIIILADLVKEDLTVI